MKRPMTYDFHTKIVFRRQCDPRTAMKPRSFRQHVDGQVFSRIVDDYRAKRKRGVAPTHHSDASN
jgi:hypothetical protein